jgi:hypothetical protein
MKMSAALKSSLGSALSNVLGGASSVCVFVTGDTRSLADINTALATGTVTPAAAGFTSLTGSTLAYVNVSTPVVGQSTISITCTLQGFMTAHTAGTATYLVVCSSNTMTSGVVYAVLPIAATNAPVIMNNTALSVDDIVALPVLTLSVPVA